MPAGSFANASFVGANTVYGPGPASVSVKPAAWTAVTSVEKSGLLAAMSTIVVSVAGSSAVSDCILSSAAVVLVAVSSVASLADALLVSSSEQAATVSPATATSASVAPARRILEVVMVRSFALGGTSLGLRTCGHRWMKVSFRHPDEHRLRRPFAYGHIGFDEWARRQHEC